MSRIDDALKRASGRSGDAEPLRAVTGAPQDDKFRLEDYPRERPLTADLAGRVVAEVRDEPSLPALPVDDGRRRLEAVQTAPERKVIVNAGPALMEQYRRLATAVTDAQSERRLRTVMVTSVRQQEGKTSTAVDLALTLSKSHGRRVLLIDADLRHPSVHEALGLRHQIGLNEALYAGWRELPLIEISPLFAVLPGGQPDVSPLTALTSQRMRALLEQCAAGFDCVLIDTPPVSLLPDPQILARLVHGIVFVIGGRSTTFPEVARAVAELGRERILGTILRGIDEPSPSATT